MAGIVIDSEDLEARIRAIRAVFPDARQAEAEIRILKIEVRREALEDLRLKKKRERHGKN